MITEEMLCAAAPDPVKFMCPILNVDILLRTNMNSLYNLKRR